MKRWALGLFGLSALVGLGWLGVTWFQHRANLQDTSLPDLSKTPVNAEAANWADSPVRAQRYDERTLATSANGAGSTDRAPADPFQGISQTAATLTAPTANSGAGAADRINDQTASRAVVGDRYANDNRYAENRYAGAEPQTLNTDPAAQPLAPEPNSYRNSSSMGSESANERNTPVDYRNNSAETMRAQPAVAAGLSAPGAEPTDESRALNQRGGGMKGAEQGDAVNGMRPAAAGSGSNGNGDFAMEARLNPARISSLPAGDRYGNSTVVAATDRQMAPANIRPDNAFPMNQSPATAANSGGLRQPTSLDNANAFAASTPSSSPSADSAAGLLTRSNIGLTSASVTSSALNNSGINNPNSSTGMVQEGFGKPGDKKLEGAQTPSVTIEKIAPPEIQVGKTAKFQIVVRNTGSVIAEDVEVTDPVPQGTQLVSTTPHTTTGPRGEILWKAGDLRPGEDSKLEVELLPIAEGEIGSTASVQFRTAASMRTVATKPELVLDLNSPQQVLIGQNLTLHIKLSNPGTGAASKVALSARLPPNLQHQAGSELEFDVGQFKPGDSRELELTLHAAQAGPCTLAISAQGDANLHTEQTANIEVIAPRLEVKLAGPGLRYLDKQAKYTVSVSNPGTAPARDITLLTRLPKGMQFVEASDSGHFDATNNAVMWGLDELPAGQSGSVTLTALAKETGDQKLRSEIKAEGGLSDANEQVTMVEGVAAVAFTVTSIDDPVEVGGKATYEIHVVNQGSKAANHLQIMAVLPDGMQPVSGEGPSKQVIDGQKIIFEPLARLEPKRDFTYKVVGLCSVPGDMRVQVYMQSEEMSKPVVKEEGTKVYKD